MSHWEAIGATDEWYTPPYIFAALGVSFDLDVAHPGDATCHVPARRWITRDSLSQEWEGFVWMNPPFGGRNALGPWMEKFFAHGDGVALTPDRTSAPWFHEAWRKADAVLFTRKIRFLRPDGSEGKSPSNGTALWASGIQAVRALQRASNIGIMAYPAQAIEAGTAKTAGLGPQGESAVPNGDAS